MIAEPEFYRHANKMRAAWSMGGTDKVMLVRIGTLAADYLNANYSAAVGARAPCQYRQYANIVMATRGVPSRVDSQIRSTSS